jgi:hypothetical protein
MTKKFTIKEIQNYLFLNDDIKSARLNLSEENIEAANYTDDIPTDDNENAIEGYQEDEESDIIEDSTWTFTNDDENI